LKNDPWLNPAFQTLPGASFTVNGAAPAKNLGVSSFGAEIHMTPCILNRPPKSMASFRTLKGHTPG